MPSWKEYQIPWDWSCEWLWAIMWVSGIELRSSARKASVLNHIARPWASYSPSSTCVLGSQACVLNRGPTNWATSPAPQYLSLSTCYVLLCTWQWPITGEKTRCIPLQTQCEQSDAVRGVAGEHYVLSTLLHVHCHLVCTHLGGRVLFHTFGSSDT